MELTEKNLSIIEDCVEKIAEQLNVPIEKIIQILEDGYKLNANQLPYKRFEELIEELRSTFNAM